VLDPELTEVGLRRDAEELKAYLENPAAFGNNVMVSYGYLGEENLTNLAAFLGASKGSEAPAGE
jgi:cytochrome c2